MNGLLEPIHRIAAAHARDSDGGSVLSINFFNAPQFAEPGRTLAAADFGQITNTLNDGRTFRFLLRFAF